MLEIGESIMEELTNFFMTDYNYRKAKSCMNCVHRSVYKCIVRGKSAGISMVCDKFKWFETEESS